MVTLSAPPLPFPSVRESQGRETDRSYGKTGCHSGVGDAPLLPAGSTACLDLSTRPGAEILRCCPARRTGLVADLYLRPAPPSRPDFPIEAEETPASLLSAEMLSVDTVEPLLGGFEPGSSARRSATRLTTEGRADTLVPAADDPVACRSHGDTAPWIDPGILSDRAARVNRTRAAETCPVSFNGPPMGQAVISPLCCDSRSTRALGIRAARKRPGRLLRPALSAAPWLSSSRRRGSLSRALLAGRGDSGFEPSAGYHFTEARP